MQLQATLQLEDVLREELQELIDSTPEDAVLTAETSFETAVEDFEDRWTIESFELKALWGGKIFLTASVDFDGITKDLLREFLHATPDEAEFCVELMVVDSVIHRPLLLNAQDSILIARWSTDAGENS